MNILEASFMGIGLAMDALAVSLALGTTGWSCPKNRVSASAPDEKSAERDRDGAGSAEAARAPSDIEHGRGRLGRLLRRMPFFSPTPAAPVCAVCRSHGPCACAKTGPTGECSTATDRRTPLTWDKIVLTAASFGVFQALMPVIGWSGSGLLGGIEPRFGRIAAGGLLVFVAVQMLREGLSSEEDSAKRIGVCSLRRLIVLSFATSIDALLVGVSYTCLGRTDIAGDVLIIGAVTAAISAAGCVCGRLSGSRFGNRSPVLGGAVLLGIAVKIMFFG